jgi:hypothetical protein
MKRETGRRNKRREIMRMQETERENGRRKEGETGSNKERYRKS